MSKKELLLEIVADVRSLADNLQMLVDGMNDNYEVEEKPKQISLEEIRSVLAVKSKDGFTEQIKEIINGFGADKLSDVEPSNYEDLLKEAEKLE